MFQSRCQNSLKTPKGSLQREVSPPTPDARGRSFQVTEEDLEQCSLGSALGTRVLAPGKKVEVDAYPSLKSRAKLLMGPLEALGMCLTHDEEHN